MYGLGEINVGNIRQRRQPGEHIGEFGGQIVLVAIAPLLFRDGLGKFADLFDQPEKGRRGPSRGISLVVPLVDELLKLGDGHRRAGTCGGHGTAL